MPLPREAALVFLLAIAVNAQGTHDRDKVISEFNASVGECTDGYEGVIVELQDATNGGRRLGTGNADVARNYLERLSTRVRARSGHKRALSELLLVHQTFATLMTGFAATLDDTVLDIVFNDTDEVRGVEANWCVGLVF